MDATVKNFNTVFQYAIFNLNFAQGLLWNFRILYISVINSIKKNRNDSGSIAGNTLLNITN